MFFFEGNVPCVSFFTAFDVLTHLIHLKFEGLNLLHLNQYISQIEIITYNMPYYHATLITTLAFLTTLALSLPPPVYTIHYVRNYRIDQVQNNFGCGKSIVFGTYL